MNNFHSDGNHITIPAPKTVPAGTPVSFGGVVIAPITDAVSTEPCAFNTQGVFAFPKATGVSFSIGDAAFLVDANDNISTSGDTYAGVAMEAAGNDATSVLVWVLRRGPQGEPGGT